MTTPFLWLAALGPFALIVAAISPGEARRATGWTLAAAIFAFLTGLFDLAAVAIAGPLVTGTVGVAGIGLALDLDGLSAAMAALVALIGLVVIAYSRNYLDGDAGQARFVRRLAATLASVLLLILAGNLFQLFLAWIATSAGLSGLLLFYADRPAARLAARKKWLVSRLGDLCLVVAMALIYRSVGSLDYAALLSDASGADLRAPVVLITLAALIRSAQFPLHGWLLEVMETPTPVSALLHAGVINAGGFLVLRFSPLIVHSSSAMHLLTIVGAVTALFGSVVMLPQTSVKVSLAYSTIAQMGFMMLECGLGSFSSAALHILAHSLYKAHAFLSSGSVIDIARAAWTPRIGAAPHPARLVFAAALSLGLVGAGAVAFGESATQPGILTLGAVLALGLVPLFANAIDESQDAYALTRALVVAALVVGAYLGLQRLSLAALSRSLGAAPTAGAFDDIAPVIVVAAFAALTILQALLPSLAPSPFWQALYAHVANGFYLNTLANRWVLRLWPTGAASRT